jgi:hypothetical protein
MSRRALAVLAPFALAALVIVGAATGGPVPPDTTPPNVTITLLSDTEADGPAGAVFNYSVTAEDPEDPSVTQSCTAGPTSGTDVPVGSTVTVECEATNASGLTGQASLSFTAQDTTPPTVTPPSDASFPDTAPFGDENVAYDDSATAADIVDGSVPASCTPPSPQTFTVGPHTITCSATDSHDRTGIATFTVTVEAAPNSPPSIDVLGLATVEATGPGGGSLSYTYNASDLEDGTPSVLCDQAQGAAIAVGGSLTVTCTATDSASATAVDSLTQSAIDTTPPVVSVPGSMTVPSAGPSVPVSFSASASDLVSGSLTPVCTPASGSQFTIAGSPHLVTCTATDGAGNQGSNSFSISVQDSEAPTVTVPASKTVEANGPTGALVTYESPTAVDAVDGPIPNVNCNRPSGSNFQLGVTLVTCTATDSTNHTGGASFTITVADTTPPVLTIPANLAIQSSSSIPATDSRIKSFLDGATATDIVDASPAITTNAPSSFPLGTTTVVFTAKDDAGNKAEKSAVVTVTTGPVEPQPDLDTTPPGNVRNIKAVAGNLSVSISWQPPSRDFDHVEVNQSPGPKGEASALAYKGKNKKLVVKGLDDGVEYRFVIVAFDKAGNRSAGVAVVTLAERQALLSPVNGATLTSAFTVKWRPLGGVKYYNAQIWFEPGVTARGALAKSKLRKVQSLWPAKPTFKLKKSWTFEGKRYTLKPGHYLVYVWPGIGPKSDGTYGKLYVEAEFFVRKR